jgi:carbon-monoxide dehydrogenase medium subunit
MTPHAFDYRRAGTVADALAQLQENGEDARFLAGGHSLIPAMKLRLNAPTALIDLNGLEELKGIELNGMEIRIGALTTHRQVELSDVVRKKCPVLAEAASGIGDPQVRNRGTLGGSLANNDPAADYPAAALGLGATIQTDQRSIAADDFFKGLYETALKEGEIIVSVSFPVPEKAGWQKFKQPASRFSLVGVFVAKGAQGVRVAVTGAGACAFRATALEEALSKAWSSKSIEGVVIAPDGLNTDLHASAAYRAHLVGVLARRAIDQTG